MGDLQKLIPGKGVIEMRKRFKILKDVKKTEIIPGEMSDLDINMISLVQKGANKQKIQIYKEDDAGDEQEQETEEKGLFHLLKSYFSKDTIEKADTPKKTFAGMMAVNDITENMWRANDTLRSVMRDIINNEEIKDKKVALLQAIDEYCSYMKEKINVSKIAKGDRFFDIPEVEIEKAGKKVSSKNLEALKEAHKALAGVIGDAEPDMESDGGSNVNKEDIEVKKEDLAEVMKQTMADALKPINDRLDKIEKAENVEIEQDNKESAGENGQEDITEILKSVVGEALKPIESRLEKVEKSRGLPRSLEGDEEQKRIEKETDVFDGLFVAE